MELQRAYFPSGKDDCSRGALTRDQIRTCHWTIICLLNMYEFGNVIFVENSKESTVMRYTAKYCYTVLVLLQ